jgi:hypothetical protein
MAWCLIKHRNTFTVLPYLCFRTQLSKRAWAYSALKHPVNHCRRCPWEDNSNQDMFSCVIYDVLLSFYVLSTFIEACCLCLIETNRLCQFVSLCGAVFFYDMNETTLRSFLVATLIWPLRRSLSGGSQWCVHGTRIFSVARTTRMSLDSDFLPIKSTRSKIPTLKLIVH